MEYKCSRCQDTGVIETGNNDMPCFCEAGATAIFNVAGHDRPMTGAEVNAELESLPRCEEPGCSCIVPDGEKFCLLHKNKVK